MNPVEATRTDGTEPGSSSPTTATMREIATNAIRYWEPRRVIYNGVLAAIVLGYFAAAWPASREAVTLDHVMSLFVLAVLANLCYCSAYVVDIFAQLSDFRGLWLRWRWILLAIGLVFASILTRFTASDF